MSVGARRDMRLCYNPHTLPSPGPMTADLSDAPKTYILRHGAMRLLGEFGAPPDLTFARGDRVVAKTERGQEVGDVSAGTAGGPHLPDPTRGSSEP